MPFALLDQYIILMVDIMLCSMEYFYVFYNCISLRGLDNELIMGFTYSINLFYYLVINYNQVITNSHYEL